MVVVLLPLSLLAAVAAVDNEDGVQWRQWGGCLFDGATQQLAGAHREDERVAQRESTQQPAGARRREGGAVRGRREDETTGQRETTQQPDKAMRQQEGGAVRGRQKRTSVQHDQKTRQGRDKRQGNNQPARLDDVCVCVLCICVCVL